jgi:hypothetical protein
VHLIEIFLPVSDNAGRRFTDAEFARVREQLADKFGGVTFFTRAPAQGVSDEGGRQVRDDIIVVEVMADDLDTEWWGVYRRTLEQQFRQDEVLIRASQVVKL